MLLFASPSVTAPKKESPPPSAAPTTTTAAATATEASEKDKEKEKLPTGVVKEEKEKEEEVICKSFEELKVAGWLVDSLHQLGIRRPTPVQAHCIPPLLAGKDVLGEAQTGSGKTAAFAVPILDILSRDPYGIFALVLTPTRELGGQIADQFRALGARMGARVQLMTGGMETVTQYTEIFAKPHVVIATPGRLCDFLDTEPLAKSLFRNVKFVIYDEADRLLNPNDGFFRFLRKIAQFLPPPGTGRCQYGLFTATAAPLLSRFRKFIKENESKETELKSVKKECDDVDAGSSSGSGSSSGDSSCEKPCEKEVVKVAEKPKKNEKVDFFPLSKDAYVYSTAEGGVVDGTSLRQSEAVVVDSCQQRYVFLPSALRECYLVYILRSLPAAQKQTIVFTATCKTAEYLHQMLETLSFRSVSLHSDLNQRERTNALAAFRSGLARIMISTDVASRGLDIQDVDLVINYDIPRATDDYVHRIGRTARAGRRGTSIVFVTPDTVLPFKRIEKGIGKTLEEQPIPEEDALACLSETSKAREISDMYLDTIEFSQRHTEKKMYRAGKDANQKPRRKKRKITPKQSKSEKPTKPEKSEKINP